MATLQTIDGKRAALKLRLCWRYRKRAQRAGDAAERDALHAKANICARAYRRDMRQHRALVAGYERACEYIAATS